MEEELLDFIIDEYEGMEVSSEIVDLLVDLVSDEEIELEMVENFEDEALLDEVAEADETLSVKEKIQAGAKKFGRWLKSNMTFGNMLLLGTGAIMIYQLVRKNAETAKNGKRINSTAAIKGSMKTLICNYEKTVRQPAIKAKAKYVADGHWNQKPKVFKDTINNNIEVTGTDYWLEIGSGVIEAILKMPIYDPTGATTDIPEPPIDPDETQLNDFCSGLTN